MERWYWLSINSCSEGNTMKYLILFLGVSSLLIFWPRASQAATQLDFEFTGHAGWEAARHFSRAPEKGVTRFH